MTRQQLREWITATNGIVFSIDFIKRSNGEQRIMAARTGVKAYVTGKGMAYNPEDKGLVVVWDMNAPGKDGQRGGYRMIPIENVQRVKVEGEWQKVED